MGGGWTCPLIRGCTGPRWDRMDLRSKRQISTNQRGGTHRLGSVAERGPGHPIQSRGAPLHDTCHPRSECEKTCAEAIPKPTQRRSSGGGRKASAGMVFFPSCSPKVRTDGWGWVGGGHRGHPPVDIPTNPPYPQRISQSHLSLSSSAHVPIFASRSTVSISTACAEDGPVPVSPPSLHPLRHMSISLGFFVDSVWIDRPGRIPSWLPIGRSGFPRRWVWNLDHLSIHHTSCSVPRVLRQQPTRVLRPPPSIHRTKTMAATSFVQQAVAKALGVNQVAKVSERGCTKRHTDPREREMAQNSKDGNRTKTSARRRGFTHASFRGGPRDHLERTAKRRRTTSRTQRPSDTCCRAIVHQATSLVHATDPRGFDSHTRHDRPRERPSPRPPLSSTDQTAPSGWDPTPMVPSPLT